MANEFVVPERKRKKTTVGRDPDYLEEIDGSGLRAWLLTEFAWGRISPQQVQRVAQLALSDARTRKLRDLAPLSKLRSYGVRSGATY